MSGSGLARRNAYLGLLEWSYRGGEATRKIDGLCSEGSHRLLVYEYLKNGSLDLFLGSPPEVWWVWHRDCVLQQCRILFRVALFSK